MNDFYEGEYIIYQNGEKYEIEPMQRIAKANWQS